MNPARGVLQSWVWNREAILKTWVPRYSNKAVLYILHRH